MVFFRIQSQTEERGNLTLFNQIKPNLSSLTLISVNGSEIVTIHQKISYSRRNHGLVGMYKQLICEQKDVGLAEYEKKYHFCL